MLLGALFGPLSAVLGTTLIFVLLCSCSLHLNLNLLQFIEIDLEEELLLDDFVVELMELSSQDEPLRLILTVYKFLHLGAKAV